MTQKQLADKVGIKQNMISEYERGKRNLSIDMAKKISTIIDLNYNVLFCLK
jgi:transcriptional regulator with XRE-family HTH domain